MPNILLQNNSVEYTHRRVRRMRSMRVSIKKGAKIVISTPFCLTIKKVEEFLSKHGAWILENLSKIKEKEKNSIFPSSHKDFLLNKSKARRLVREKIDKLNKIYNFRYNKITIRDVSSRWGSCSRAGNLNFSYKVVFLPDEVAEYIVAHELSHLKEMNHSARFWSLVGKTVPNYFQLRKKLRNIF